jgi:hypothetical protein
MGQQHVLTAGPQEQPATPQPVTHSGPPPTAPRSGLPFAPVDNSQVAVDTATRLRGAVAATAAGEVRPIPPQPTVKRATRASTARTKVGRAVLKNRVQIVLNLETLRLLIDDKIDTLPKKPNSPEAKRELAHYKNLKKNVEAFRSTTLKFSAGKIRDAAAAKSTKSFADGVGAWWTKRHVEICDKAFEMALFLSAVGVCSLAGAGGAVAVAVSGAIVKGKPVIDVLKALSKKANGRHWQRCRPDRPCHILAIMAAPLRRRLLRPAGKYIFQRDT